MEEENQTEKLFKLNLSIDRWWTDTRTFLEQIKAQQDPSYRFKCWRNSTEGKTWKQEQYLKQNHKCLICGEHLDISDSHIDHIKPISKYPTEALNLDNLQLVHPKCNLRKGKKS